MVDAYVAFQLVDQPVVILPSVDVEFANVLRPVKVLLLVRRVVEETVMLSPREKLVPLMVPKVPVRRLVPIEDVETRRPF